jgi:hypothetical protein
MSPVAITLTREWRSRRAGREFEPCAPQWSIKYREQLDVLLLVLIGRADHIDGGAKPMVARGLIGPELRRCGPGSAGAFGVFARRRLGELLPTTQNVDSLAIDHLRKVGRRFAVGMERTLRENLLLEHAPPHAK